MKSILGGFAAAILLTLIAWFVLDTKVQQSAIETYTVPSARP